MHASSGNAEMPAVYTTSRWSRSTSKTSIRVEGWNNDGELREVFVVRNVDATRMVLPLGQHHSISFRDAMSHQRKSPIRRMGAPSSFHSRRHISSHAKLCRTHNKAINTTDTSDNSSHQEARESDRTNN